MQFSKKLRLGTNQQLINLNFQSQQLYQILYFQCMDQQSKQSGFFGIHEHDTDMDMHKQTYCIYLILNRIFKIDIIFYATHYDFFILDYNCVTAVTIYSKRTIGSKEGLQFVPARVIHVCRLITIEKKRFRGEISIELESSTLPR